MAKLQTFQWFDGKALKTQFGWRLIDDNGEKIAASEGYTTRSSARRGAENLVSTVLEMVAIDGDVEVEDL